MAGGKEGGKEGGKRDRVHGFFVRVLQVSLAVNLFYLGKVALFHPIIRWEPMCPAESWVSADQFLLVGPKWFQADASGYFYLMHGNWQHSFRRVALHAEGIYLPLWDYLFDFERIWAVSDELVLAVLEGDNRPIFQKEPKIGPPPPDVPPRADGHLDCRLVEYMASWISYRSRTGSRAWFYEDLPHGF